MVVTMTSAYGTYATPYATLEKKPSKVLERCQSGQGKSPSICGRTRDKSMIFVKKETLTLAPKLTLL